MHFAMEFECIICDHATPREVMKCVYSFSVQQKMAQAEILKMNTKVK